MLQPDSAIVMKIYFTLTPAFSSQLVSYKIYVPIGGRGSLYVSWFDGEVKEITHSKWSHNFMNEDFDYILSELLSLPEILNQNIGVDDTERKNIKCIAGQLEIERELIVSFPFEENEFEYKFNKIWLKYLSKIENSLIELGFPESLVSKG